MAGKRARTNKNMKAAKNGLPAARALKAYQMAQVIAIMECSTFHTERELDEKGRIVPLAMDFAISDDPKLKKLFTVAVNTRIAFLTACKAKLGIENLVIEE